MLTKKQIKELEDKRKKLEKKNPILKDFEFPYYQKKYQTALYEKCYNLLNEQYDIALNKENAEFSMAKFTLNSLKNNYAKTKLSEIEDLKTFLKELAEYPNMPIELSEIIKERLNG